MKTTAPYQFTNWAKNKSCTVKNFFQPETEDELVDVVKQASKIRLAGTGHSWNDICLNNEALLNLDHYNKVLGIDKDKLQVKVQAGIKLWQLNEILDKNGLALSNLGSISRQSVAGAISTGTHGTGITFNILGSQVQEFTLIKPDGEIITVNRNSGNNLFNLALVNLGSLGAVSEITLNVVPSFNLHDQTYVADFDEVVNDLDNLVKNTHHFKLWWFPHVNKIVVYRYQRTNEPRNDSRFRQWFMDELLSVGAYRLLLKVGSINREWRKNINRALVTKFISPLNRIEKSYKVFNVPEPPLHRETEWAFPLASAKQLLREYRDMINASAHRINFIQEIRFAKADEYALSPCYKQDTIWLGVYNADNFGWKELLTDFEQMAMRYNGRPHWGKEFMLANKVYLQSRYPLWNEFSSLRAGFDPTGKFVNDYIARILL